MMKPQFLQELEGQELKKYVKQIEQSKLRKYGGSSQMISADFSVQYLTQLLREKKHNNPELILAMTEPISTQAYTRIVDYNNFEKNIPFDPTNPNSVENVSKLLSKTYNNLIKQNVNGIYTVLNSTNDGSESHQNWLYLNVRKRNLLRFEPSKDYPEFRMSDLCDLVVENLSELTGSTWTWSMAIKSHLNTFQGCRAFSTLLASMYISGVDFSHINKLLKGNVGNERLTKPFIYLAQQEMKQCNPDVIAFGRKSRRGKPREYSAIII